MPDIKRRKVPKDENVEVKRRAKSPKPNFGAKNMLRFYFLTAAGFTTCLLGLYLHLSQWSNTYSHNASLLDNLSLTLGLKNYIHAVIIDAGSTGTRVVSLGFVTSSREKTLKLHKEFFMELKPGISAFADNPAESLKNLEILIREAKTRIPQENWSETYLMMKATAGLRLLSKPKADGLLREARKLFNKSGFKTDNDSVSVMDGIDEGLFSWFSVNFLLDRLGSDPSKTVVALDLGGGSVQVSFVPSKVDSLTPPDLQYLTKIAAFHKKLDVYSRSYLRLGLNEARKQILQYNSNHSLEFKSECINPLVKMKWNYEGKEYIVQGPENPHYSRSEEKGEWFDTPIVDYKNCEEIVKNVVLKFDKAPSLEGKEIFAFSYYFDKAAESGLIDLRYVDLKRAVVTLKDFITTAKAKCREANVDQPFMCLDLVFITVMLKEMFGVSEATEINLVKELDGHEVSWALGAAFLYLQSRME